MNLLNARLEIGNPFDRWEYFKNLGCISGKLFGHKAYELEHTFYTGLVLDAEVRWTRNTDHAGIECGIGIFGYGIHFRIYDTRHWNYERNCYEAYDTV